MTLRMKPLYGNFLYSDKLRKVYEILSYPSPHIITVRLNHNTKLNSSIWFNRFLDLFVSDALIQKIQ